MNVRKCDYTGQKYGRLTFVRPAKNKGKSMWELLCDCGNTCYARSGSVTNKSVKKATKSCGCWLQERMKLLNESRRKFHPKISTARAIWRDIYSDAKWETFYNLSQQNCYYCGNPPSTTRNVASRKRKNRQVSAYQKREGDFTYNGLDRVDSSRTHSDDNVVPCCPTCNRMKMNMPNFLEQVKLIYEFSITNMAEHGS